jgi:sporulation protein YlmC with PRC-barrel domain
MQALSVLAGLSLAGAVTGQTQSQPQQSQPQQQSQQPSQQQPGQTGKEQSKDKEQGKEGQASRGATRDAPVAGKVPLGVTVEETDLILKGWRASKLVGADVYNDENKKIGKIEDMIVSPDGKVSAAIVDVGGFLGLGKHRVAIPVDQFADISAKKLVLPKATKEALKELPQFQYAKGDEPRKRG